MVQIQAKPTAYSGQNFRSRLEARWAAFFDIIDWQWTYEPYSLNQAYIPDFLIHGNAPFLVEVKPASNFDELIPVADDIRSRGINLHNEQGKQTDLVVVGASPVLPPHPERPMGYFERPLFGLSMDSFAADNDFAVWDSHKPAVWAEEYGDFTHRPTGTHEGDHHLRYDADPNFLIAAWRMAGNETQWKPRS